MSFVFTGLNVTMRRSRWKMLVNFKMEKRKKALVCQFHPCPSFLTSVNVTNPIDGVCCLAATFKKTFLVAYSVGVYSEFYPWPHLSSAFRLAEWINFLISIYQICEEKSHNWYKKHQFGTLRIQAACIIYVFSETCVTLLDNSIWLGRREGGEGGGEKVLVPFGQKYVFLNLCTRYIMFLKICLTPHHKTSFSI